MSRLTQVPAGVSYMYGPPVDNRLRSTCAQYGILPTLLLPGQSNSPPTERREPSRQAAVRLYARGRRAATISGTANAQICLRTGAYVPAGSCIMPPLQRLVPGRTPMGQNRTVSLSER